MDAVIRETIRYLGYGNHAVDDQTMDLILVSLKELEQAAGKRFIYRVFCADQDNADHIRIGKLDIESKSLERNLKDCSEVILMAATLGVGVDYLIKKVSLTQMSKAVVLQAAASALLEDYVGKEMADLADEYMEQGLFLRPRFSPGYGDLPLDYQKVLFSALNITRRIGVTLTDSGLMLPQKSVTAVLGISPTPRGQRTGCAHCPMNETCAYRKEGTTCENQ